jgi:hypothetical protein
MEIQEAESSGDKEDGKGKPGMPPEALQQVNIKRGIRILFAVTP